MSRKELELRARQARRAQREEMRRAALNGDAFAAYWAGSASASVMHHYRAGAVVDIKA